MTTRLYVEPFGLLLTWEFRHGGFYFLNTKNADLRFICIKIHMSYGAQPVSHEDVGDKLCEAICVCFIVSIYLRWSI